MKARVEYHGSIVLVRPGDTEAREWFEANTDGTWWAGALVVEPRYIGDLMAGFAEEGGEHG